MKSKVYDLPRSFLKDAAIKLAVGFLKVSKLDSEDFCITGLRFEDAGACAFAVKTQEPHFGEDE